MASITINGYLIEDEGLGLTTLAADSDTGDPYGPDNNVVLSSFQSSVPTSSTLGAALTTLSIYPSTMTGTGTAAAIGISESAIVTTSGVDNSTLQFATSGGGSLSGVNTGFKAIDGGGIFLYSDPSNPDIVLGREGTFNGTTWVPSSSGKVAFALLLQPTSAGATIWAVQYEALTDPQNGSEDANLLKLTDLVYVERDVDHVVQHRHQDARKQLLAAVRQQQRDVDRPRDRAEDSSAASPDTVNTSSVGDGSDSNSITPGAALRFDFVSNYTGTKTQGQDLPHRRLAQQPGLHRGHGGKLNISTTSPTGGSVNVQIIAQNKSNATFNSTDTSTTSNPVALGEIDVYNSSATLIASSARTSGNNGITFGGTTTAPNGVVNGLTAGDAIQFASLNNAPFDQFVVENVDSKNSFRVLNVTETQTNSASTEVGSHILFEDSVPTDSTATVTATDDEDALVSVTPGETGFTGTATGNVSSLFNPGVDLPLTYRLSGSTSGLPTLTSGGNAVTYSLSSAAGVDTLTASYTIGTTTTTVFTFALTEATGAYTFTLSAPIDQDESGPPNSAGEGVFSFSSLSSC